MNDPDPILVAFVTAPDAQEAERLADALLERRLVACVNVVPGVESFYWWEGSRERGSEVLLVAKTRRGRWEELLRVLRETHSYEVFEAIAFPVAEGNPEYLEWIRRETAAAES